MKRNPIIIIISLVFLHPACQLTTQPSPLKFSPLVHRYRSLVSLDSMVLILPDSSKLSIETLCRNNWDSFYHVVDFQLMPKRDLQIYFAYTVPNGFVQRLTWADGTSIALDAGSTIQFNNRDRQGQRKYLLEGRAIVIPIGHRNDTFSITTSKETIVQSYTDSLYLDCYKDRVNEIIATTGGTTFIDAKGVELLMNSGGGVQFTPAGVENLTNFKVPTAQNLGRAFKFYAFSPFEIAEEFTRWYNRSVIAVHTDSAKLFTGVFPRNIQLDSACSELDQMFHLKLDYSKPHKK